MASDRYGPSGSLAQAMLGVIDDLAVDFASFMIPNNAPRATAATVKPNVMDDATLAKLIPKNGVPNIDTAESLWQTQRIRLPNFYATLNRLNKNETLIQNPEPSTMNTASEFDSVATINKRRLVNEWRTEQRNRWMALLDEQGLSVQPDAINSDLYDFVYDRTGKSSRGNAGSHARYWLLKVYGNFPVGVQENGATILLLDKWPSDTAFMRKVALYGMYPSLDGERSVMEKRVAIHQRSQATILNELAELGAKSWNIQRVVDVGVKPNALGNFREIVIRHAIKHANIPLLEAIKFRPYRVNLKTDDGTQAANILLHTRRDMWDYIMPMNKAEMQAVYPKVAAGFHESVRELLASLKG